MTRTSAACAVIVCGFLFFGEALLAPNSGAQTAQPVASRANSASIDEEIAMLRSDLRSNRKQVVAANMKLSDTEAEKFWPTYEQYVSELVKINDAKYALIKEYLQSSNLTEEQADGMSNCPAPAQIHSHFPQSAFRQGYGDVLSDRPAGSNDDRPATSQRHSADSTRASLS
jgi:hypothetical protein